MFNAPCIIKQNLPSYAVRFSGNARVFIIYFLGATFYFSVLSKKSFLWNKHFPRMSMDFPSSSMDFPRWFSDFPRRSSDFPSSSMEFPRWSSDFPRWSRDFLRRSSDFSRNKNNMLIWKKKIKIKVILALFQCIMKFGSWLWFYLTSNIGGVSMLLLLAMQYINYWICFFIIYYSHLFTFLKKICFVSLHLLLRYAIGIYLY